MWRFQGPRLVTRSSYKNNIYNLSFHFLLDHRNRSQVTVLACLHLASISLSRPHSVWKYYLDIWKSELISPWFCLCNDAACFTGVWSLQNFQNIDWACRSLHALETTNKLSPEAAALILYEQYHSRWSCGPQREGEACSMEVCIK